MNELAPTLFAVIEGDPRAKLDQLEWEMLPNEIRNVERLAPWRHPQPAVVEALPAPKMTPADWEAW